MSVYKPLVFEIDAGRMKYNNNRSLARDKKGRIYSEIRKSKAYISLKLIGLIRKYHWLRLRTQGYRRNRVFMVEF